MFKCHVCKQTTKPKESRKVVVTETREKVYECWSKGDSFQSHGREIVKEVSVCPRCVDKEIV